MFNASFCLDARQLRSIFNFLLVFSLICVALAMPEMAHAEGGGFLGDTSAFEGDVQKSWTIATWLFIFLGLFMFILGFLAPSVSWLKWAGAGVIVISAMGESIVHWLYSVGGNTEALEHGGAS